jgi:polyphosphate:AMP phosphotransferase
MHLSKNAQKKRLKFLEKDPLLHWRISKSDWENWRNYDAFIMAAERTMLKTSTGFAPWKVVEGYDERFRSIEVATILRDAIQHQLRERKLLKAMNIEAAVVEEASAEEVAQPPVTVLSCLDMKQGLAKAAYNAQLRTQQGRLNRLQERARERGVSTIVVLEGWDAAGKGGAIRRVTHAVDSRDYQVIQVAAPTDEERAHHYLWRFWRHLPRAGRITIYDRSWYGRVFVERIEGYATENEWQRAYTEINDFEEQLTEFGIAVVKFWVHITKDEQLERFKARERTPYKAWKLTDDDWRNRERWGDYELAVSDAVERTSTREAPWILVEGDDKRYARVKIVKTVCDRIEEVLGPEDEKSK